MWNPQTSGSVDENFNPSAQDILITGRRMDQAAQRISLDVPWWQDPKIVIFIWGWVKTNSTPGDHIKIAGIYGCSFP